MTPSPAARCVLSPAIHGPHAQVTRTLPLAEILKLSPHPVFFQETGGPGTYVFLPVMSVNLNKSLALPGPADIDHSFPGPGPGPWGYRDSGCSASGNPQTSLGVCLGNPRSPLFLSSSEGASAGKLWGFLRRAPHAVRRGDCMGPSNLSQFSVA